jgi:formamidopyrimidine-DNA glycosylase
LLEEKINKIGPDIMDIAYADFYNILMKKNNEKKYIGNILVKQNLISGIGNYLRSEILWLSKLSPYRKVSKITEFEMKHLFYNSQLLTWGSYNFKKAIKLHKIKSDETKPSSDFMVYKKTHDVYGNPVVKEEMFDGSQKRFIYWVKEIQT